MRFSLHCGVFKLENAKKRPPVMNYIKNLSSLKFVTFPVQ